MMVLVMNNYTKKIIILLFLCYTKDAAKSPKKLTNSNQKKTLPGLSVFLKPFQAKEVKQIDLDDYQKNTMEWAHERLIQFTRNLDVKIFNTKKDVNPETMGVNKLEKAPDKKTVFSWQWQEMKSHYLNPRSKRHTPVYFYTDDTFQLLKKIKKDFLDTLELYRDKLQALWNEKAKIKIDDDPYDIEDNPNFNPNIDLIAEKTVLHHEIFSLLNDLPQTLMYWSWEETDSLTRFAEQFGPLPTKDTIDQKRKNFGKNVKGAKAFTAAELDGDEDDSSENEKSSDSYSSFSELSSGSGSDYNTEFFNNLTRDYFISDNETVDQDRPPSPIIVPPLSNDHTHKPSDDPTESDIETRKRLHSFEGDTDWKTETSIAHDRLDEMERKKREAEGKKSNYEYINPKMELLKEQIIQSLKDTYDNVDQREIVQKIRPEVIDDIAQLKALESQVNQPKQPSPHSHSSEPSAPTHTVDSGSGGNTDHSIQKSPPKVEEIVRPSVPARIAEPSLDPPVPQRPQPDSVRDPRGTIGRPTRSAPLPPPKDPDDSDDESGISGSSYGGKLAKIGVKAEMSVHQEKENN